ncbi:helix-turn-helix domain-containing protein [Solitalea lacus]|uniref:helix-turn-helix domain-containing protein n=1 Tax=Solitalea lacus TaxID=2911172 RepID=UPI001EDA7B8E|nr:AraC family transcriptional regulator [Solitalea lacus]UKJ06824.1 AraC family transcriptional regulator [Solitalea lacus]
MQKVKDNLPVYTICSLKNVDQLHADITAEPFSVYLKRHPNLHKGHGHTFFHMLLFTQGEGFHTIDFERFRVERGQIYFMVPGQVHSWEFEGEVDGFVINFSEELFHSFISDSRYLEKFSFWNGITGENVVQLNETELVQAASLLKQIIHEVKEVKPFGKDKVRLLLLSLFILVARAEQKVEPAEALMPHLQLLYKFRKLVNQYYSQHKHPKDYASLLHISSNHLNVVCSELLNKSAGEVIRERILLEAKRKLINLDESISSIAYSLGYADNSYFTKFFKKYTGQTPENFKRSFNEL